MITYKNHAASLIKLYRVIDVWELSHDPARSICDYHLHQNHICCFCFAGSFGSKIVAKGCCHVNNTMPELICCVCGWHWSCDCLIDFKEVFKGEVSPSWSQISAWRLSSSYGCALHPCLCAPWTSVFVRVAIEESNCLTTSHCLTSYNHREHWGCSSNVCRAVTWSPICFQEHNSLLNLILIWTWEVWAMLDPLPLSEIVSGSCTVYWRTITSLLLLDYFAMASTATGAGSSMIGERVLETTHRHHR